MGSTQAELKLADSVTGELLATAVDRQIGGGSTKTAFQWQWGDAENAINNWCEKLTTKTLAVMINYRKNLNRE